MRIKSSLIAGLYAGLIAGLVLGLLVLALSRPLINRAEKYEANMAKANHEVVASPAVSYKVKNFFTLLGSVVLGGVLGLIMGFILPFLPGDSQAWWRLGLAAGFSGWIILSLVPLGAFPPNPPGIESIVPLVSRQIGWIANVLIGAVGVGLAWFTYFKLLKVKPVVRWLVPLVILAVAVALPSLLGVADKFAPTIVPAGLITEFRVTSLGSMLIFWLVLGLSTTYFNSLNEKAA